MQIKTFVLEDKDKDLKLTFRAIRKEEAPVLVDWMASSRVGEFLGSRTGAKSLEEEEKWIADSYSSKDKILFGVEFNQKLIGSWTAQINGANASTGSLIGDSNFHGKGIGTVTHKFRLWLLFTQLADRILTVESHVLWSPRHKIQDFGSYHALVKAGYSQVGTFREKHHVNGVFADEAILQALNPKYADRQDLSQEELDAIKRVQETLEWVSKNIQRV